MLEATLDGMKIIDEHSRIETGREQLAAAAWAAELPIELAGRDKLPRKVNYEAPPVQL